MLFISNFPYFSCLFLPLAQLLLLKITQPTDKQNQQISPTQKSNFETMDRGSYKAFHEMFVSNNKGTTLAEITMISFICPLSVLVTTKLEPWLGTSRSLTRLFGEFFILATPLLIAFTQLVNSFDTVFAFTVSVTFVNLLSSIGSHAGANSKRLSFLTNYRASMLLVTSICILAVDFKRFPRRFAKTEELGFGLMDIGVGSFVFSAGTVAPMKSFRLLENLRKSTPLLLLGALKVLSTKLVDYHQHVTEYGTHWNFFFSLAIVQCIAGSITCLANKRILPVLALAIGLSFELWLHQSNIYQWIFSLTTNQRLKSGFVIANIEGFVSLFGYLSLFLFGASLKNTIYNLKSNWTKSLMILLVLWSLFILVINENILILPSRRVCNLSYIIWMVLYNMTLIIWFAGVDIITGKH